LGMVRPHVALAAGGRQPGNTHRGSMPRVASGAGADGAVEIRFADAVAFLTAGGDNRLAFQLDEGIGRALAAAGVKFLGILHLTGRDALFAVHRGPAWGRMPAAEKLLILLFMAAAAVGRRHRPADAETVMFLVNLLLSGLVTFQATDTFAGVLAQLVFVDDGVLPPRVALGTLARRPDIGGARLIRLDLRALPVNQIAAKHEAKANDQGNEDGTKGHLTLLCDLWSAAIFWISDLQPEGRSNPTSQGPRCGQAPRRQAGNASLPRDPGRNGLAAATPWSRGCPRFF